MTIKHLAILAVAVALTGCATADYALYAEAQTKIAAAKASAEIARYEALSRIAQQGDTTAKVAAVISLQGGRSTPETNNTVSAPTAPGQAALQWASILVPALGQAYAVNQNARTAINSSNNNLALGLNQSNNQTALGAANINGFVSIADMINNTVVTQEKAVIVQPQIVNPVVVQPQVVNPVVIK